MHWHFSSVNPLLFFCNCNCQLSLRFWRTMEWERAKNKCNAGPGKKEIFPSLSITFAFYWQQQHLQILTRWYSVSANHFFSDFHSSIVHSSPRRMTNDGGVLCGGPNHHASSFFFLSSVPPSSFLNSFRLSIFSASSSLFSLAIFPSWNVHRCIGGRSPP